MSFITTNVEPSTNPSVTVKFAGLMLLKSPTGNTCEVGVHRFSAFHTFQAMLVVNKPDKPLTLIRLISGPLTAPLSIDVLPAPPAGFLAFARDPFNRADSLTSHQFDYRWAFNARSVHPGADFNNGARPIATLNAGILYASNLTLEDLTPELHPKPPATGAVTSLHRVAADLAVAIDLPAEGGSVVMLSWHELGVPQTLELPRDTDPDGTTYTISLMNDPPISDPFFHDELDLYYKVLEVGGLPIQPSQRFELRIPYPSKTDEIPCLPITLDP